MITEGGYEQQTVTTRSPELVNCYIWCAVYEVKLHQYHWFVKGSNFFVLHEKFEEMK